MAKTAFIHGIGGIGEAIVDELLETYAFDHLFLGARQPNQLRQDLLSNTQITMLRIDLEKPESLDQASDTIKTWFDQTGTDKNLDLVMNTCGLLHSDSFQPEKRLESLNLDQLQQTFQVNAFLPMLVFQKLLPFVRGKTLSHMVNISAKVGSIEDNRLGGWYSYRSSKAALNMMTKTLAIECQQRRINTCLLAVHPGTVKTGLSNPITNNGEKTGQKKILTPKSSACAILKGVFEKTAADSGQFFTWDGQILPW